jgi:signal peptidase I
MEETQTTAERSPPERQEVKRLVVHFLAKLLTLCLAIWVIFTFVFGIRQNSGNTMFPAIHDRDLMLYYRLESDYEVEDVVVFSVQGHNRIGRVVARGGDVINVNEDGYLTVNGHTLVENEIFYPTFSLDGVVTYPYTVEEGSYFLLCDYRTGSSDSRAFGAIAKGDIDGKVIAILRQREI